MSAHQTDSTPPTPQVPRKPEDFPPVRACLFDMDGLLLNTEDIYTEVTNTMLAEYGRPPLPWAIKAQLQGRTSVAASEILLKWANLPDITPEQWLHESHQHQQQLFPHCQPLPGVTHLLDTLSTSPSGLHLALATSSNRKNYLLKTASHPHIFTNPAIFPPELLVLGDDPRVAPGRGKPCPDIYELALACVNERIVRLGLGRVVRREECLVFEDAVPGVEAARRAGMRVVWVPHGGLRGLVKGREGEVLAGLAGDGKEEGDGLVLEEKEGMKGRGERFVGDGWGEERDSLVGFDYARYGIEVRKEEGETQGEVVLN